MLRTLGGIGADERESKCVVDELVVAVHAGAGACLGGKGAGGDAADVNTSTFPNSDMGIAVLARPMRGTPFCMLHATRRADHDDDVPRS